MGSQSFCALSVFSCKCSLIMGLMLKELGKVTCPLTYSARRQPSGLFREYAGAGTDAARGGTLGISHRSWLKSAQVSRGCSSEKLWRWFGPWCCAGHTVQAADLPDKDLLFFIVHLTCAEDLAALTWYGSSVLLPRVQKGLLSIKDGTLGIDLILGWVTQMLCAGMLNSEGEILLIPSVS